jgi:hypothetical protein
MECFFLMMFKARQNKGSITRFARANLEVQHLVPTEQEWSTCEIMERVLEPFYDFTRSVSKEKPCLPETLGIMWGLDDLLDDVGNATGQFGDVGNDIREAFKAGVALVEEYTKLINENMMYYAASILDPRIKCNLIKEQCGDGANNIIEKVRVYLKEEWQKIESCPARSTDTQLPPSANLHQLGLLRRARKSNGSTASDIDRYLDTGSIDWDELDESNYDPDWVLKWWKANSFQYPLMAAAARALLAVPGSEVDVERLFLWGKRPSRDSSVCFKGRDYEDIDLVKGVFREADCSRQGSRQGVTSRSKYHYFLIR